MTYSLQENKNLNSNSTAEHHSGQKQTEITPLLFLTSCASSWYLKTAAWKNCPLLAWKCFFLRGQSEWCCKWRIQGLPWHAYTTLELHDIAPKAAAISKPWGEHVSCVKFKGHTSLALSSSPPPSLSRCQEKKRSWWPIENIVFYLSLYSTFPMLSLGMHWKAAHSVAKHTAMLLMPFCLSICSPEIMAFPAQLVPTSLLIFRTGTLPPHCALCEALLVNNESGIDSKRESQIISGHVQLQEGKACFFLKPECILQ